MDDFNKKNMIEIDKLDMQCPFAYTHRKKDKPMVRRLARRRLKREDAKEINNERTGEKN